MSPFPCFCPREGREMKAICLIICKATTSFCPREGREMKACVDAENKSVVYRFCPREGREMKAG